MRLAFVSYEFAGTASGGGIGTYVRGAAAMMAARGHQVEVFTSAPADPRALPAGVVVHAAPVDRQVFPRAVASVFERRHFAQPFDVVEGPEYGAEAAEVARSFPDLPLVVKLHTPTFQVDAIQRSYLTRWQKVRFMLGGVRRGHVPKPYWHYDPIGDPEYKHAQTASEIAAPSIAILELVRSRWALEPTRLAHVPYVFDPPPDLMAIPVSTATGRITYLGRLEARKGVIELAEAMRLVLARVPAIKFRLVGRSLPHPTTGEDLATHMRRLLGPFADTVEFVDGLPHSEIPRVLGETDICVFPSVWESVGFVCLEAMAAGRGVIASGGSGMAELIDDGRSGRLVSPRDPRGLADAMLAMVADAASRISMGEKARAKASKAYISEVIGPLQEASYVRAIERGRPGRVAGR
ncbi:MAG: glycosyltransferase family 4 protein [Enhydrobacter sp.]|nr:glycosyltransferase family 4 protein [Enhydrobacter sp.]